MNLRKSVHAISAGLLIACGSQASAQPKPPAPAVQPGVISADAFPTADTSIPPELAAKFKAKLVTLNVTNMPALQAMSELAKVSGYTIKPGYDNIFNNGNRKPGVVTIAAVDQPFWAVFRDICTRGNLTLWSNGGQEDRIIRIAPGNYGGPTGMRGPVSIQGVFFTVPNYLERENTVNMASPGTVNRSIHIQMQVSFEPSASVASLAYEPVIDQATDDNGNSMVIPAAHRPNDNMQPPRGIGTWQRVTLAYPTTNPGHRIVKIKGHIPAKIQTGIETIEVPDPTKAAPITKTISGKEVTVGALRKVGDRYQLELSISRGDEPVQEFFNSFNANAPRPHLTDVKGNEASSYFSGGTANQDKRTINYGFNPIDGQPAKLVVDVPTGVQDAAIAFELDNLPLP